MKRTALQAAFGAVLGQAIGDAFGSQTEFNKGRRVTQLGPTWGYSFPAFSDDTQNFLAIADALITARPPLNYQNIDELEPFMQEFGRCYIAWTDGRYGSNDRSPGGTCMGGVHQLRRQGVEHWRETGSRNSGKGNGGAMRAGAVGVYFHEHPVKAFEVGALTSVPTHANLESMLASGGVAFLVASAIRGIPFAQSIFQLLNVMQNWEKHCLFVPECDDQSTEFALARVGQAFAGAMAGKTVAEFKQFNGNDGKGVEALAAAIHANLIHNSYNSTIIALANDTGDSDSTAAIGGCIAGARFGIENIPTKWQEQVEKSDYLFDAAEQLFNAPYEPAAEPAVPDTTTQTPAQ